MSQITLYEYQSRAIVSAVYPSQHKVFYPALSLAGEAGEVGEKVLEEGNAEGVGKEIGGVLWYCAALAQDLNTNLEEVTGHAGTLSELTSFSKAAMFDDSGEEVSKSDYALALCVFAGKIANNVKKVIRGDTLLNVKRDAIIADLSKIVYTCAFLAGAFDLDLGDIADGNLAQLASRIERGTVMGDGDNR